MSEELIELIKQYEVIYNIKLSEYRDTALKNAAWEEIAATLNLPVEECKSTWSKLRNCFNNAMKRRRMKKSGQAASKIIPWRYENQMSFLLPFLDGRETWGNIQTVDTPETFTDSTNSLPSPSAQPIPSPASYPRTPTPNAYRVKTTNDCQMTEMLGLMKKSQEVREKRHTMDETDYFFQSMSQVVKKLPKIDQSKIKMLLHSAVHEAEMKMLESQQIVRKTPINIVNQTLLHHINQSQSVNQYSSDDTSITSEQHSSIILLEPVAGPSRRYEPNLTEPQTLVNSGTQLTTNSSIINQSSPSRRAEESSQSMQTYYENF